jgi:hypothetical protein
VKPLKGFTLPTIFLIAHFVRCAHVADSFARCAFGSASNINRAKPASFYCGRCGTSQRFHVPSLFSRKNSFHRHRLFHQTEGLGILPGSYPAF